MQRRRLIVIVIAVVLITIILIVLGIMNRQQDSFVGFTGKYAVSADGLVAYVNDTNGRSEIYIHSEESPIITLNENEQIYHMTFTSNSNTLIYVTANKEINPSNLQSTIYEFNIKTMENKVLFQDEKIITEVTIDPKDEQLIYYLGATTYENYSPIARSAPHDFDIYSYSLTDGQIDRHTHFDKYGMTSLQISENDDVAYVHMDDDFDAETAEDIFETKQKLFAIQLNKQEQSIVHQTDNLEQVYDTLYIEERDIIIYQAVSGTDDDGLFQYDLYIVDLATNDIRKLTDLQEYTGQPIYSPIDEKLYFIVDTQFAKERPNYYLYRINLDGTGLEQLNLN